MKRAIVLMTAGVLVASGCGQQSRDEQELRSYLRNVGRVSRSFTYREVSKERSFIVRGSVEDDFRYRLTLSTDQGDIVEQVVSDDSMSVRVLRPELFADVPTLGSPFVDKALREGAWVTSPSGAPSLQKPATDLDAGEQLDPLLAALDSLRYALQSLSQARAVREFNPEELDYRPKEDPWVYPNTGAKQKRYDLVRPILPKREDQLGGAAGTGDVTTSNFRKLSAFERDGRVERVCEFVDVRGHEDIIRAIERGNKKSFVYKLYRRVIDKKTARPIRERRVMTTFDSPDDVHVDVPPPAQLGSLEVFLAAFTQKVTKSDLLKPATTRRTVGCERSATKKS
jgi:hypothetical protein